ncbi:MAG: hypothetical protein HOC70_01110 [Gammaproteobacteria bacterium]|jgi:hypothetical protein|nr:hypothetical protein [Gammaproteobacteria bacterium]MBT4491812.1 hypothetical protein [Gammaproteobacteria bacterium]MBT7372256.1 hypothetical protein [Gammaproteobacteria bacterium]
MYQYKKVTLDYLNSAPRKMEFVVQLPVSCKEIFSIFERRDTWQWAGIEDVIWDSEPPFNANTKRTIVQSTGSRLDEQFLLWEQDRRMVFRIENGDVGLLGALLEDYTVKPIGDDACEFTWTIAYELSGWLRFFTPLLSVLVRLLFKKMVGDFQQMVVDHQINRV